MVQIHAPGSMPDQLNQLKARRDQLVNDYLDAKAAAEKYGTIITQLAEQIVKELGVGGRHEVVSGVGVRVQAPSATFTAEKAREVLTAEQYQAISDLKPSVKIAERVLPGALVDLCRVPGAKPQVKTL